VLSWNNNEHMAWYDPTKMGTIRFTENTISAIADTRFPGISVYPNPFTDMLFVRSQALIEEFAVYSMQGEMLEFRGSLSAASLSCRMGNYQPGIYLIRLKMGAGRYLTYKISKRNQD
jgi:hypothetical protein